MFKLRKGYNKMNIGIIVHSHTGHTLSVAESLKQRLDGAGHNAQIERITAVNEDPSNKGNVQLAKAPRTDGYDVLIFGAPVRGYSLSPVMKAYLAQTSSLEGKKVGCFVTQFFPSPKMGGNQSIQQFIDLCRKKGGAPVDTGIVNWTGLGREKKIEALVDQMMKITG